MMYEEKQQLQIHFEEVMEPCCVEHAAQKARKIAKAKIRKETKKWRLVEEEDKKKWMEYLQQLWNEVLAKNIAILGDNEVFQVIGSKQKKITTIFSEDKVGQQLSKKIKENQPGKYYEDAVVKIGSINSYERYVYARQSYLAYNSK